LGAKAGDHPFPGNQLLLEMINRTINGLVQHDPNVPPTCDRNPSTPRDSADPDRGWDGTTNRPPQETTGTWQRIPGNGLQGGLRRPQLSAGSGSSSL
jgi:hypothetical protein